jgi:hypothetical protein
MTKSHWFGLGLSCSLLMGCSQPIHYYALTGGEVPVLSQRQHAGVSVGVSQVVLPKLINRPQLVVRQTAHEVKVLEQHQWAGKFQEEVTQLLLQSLQQAYPQQPIYAYPVEQRQAPQQQWSVDIQQLDGALAGVVQLQAVCRLTDRANRQTIFERQIRQAQPVSGDQVADYVAAQRQLLVRLVEQCRW